MTRRDEWTDLVTVLAAMPDVWRRLLAEHVPDGHGRCCGCTVPGHGIPGASWPCSLHLLAARAERKHRRPIRPARPRDQHIAADAA